MALGKLKFLSRLHCKVHWRGLSSGWKIMSAIMTFVKSIYINDFFSTFLPDETFIWSLLNLSYYTVSYYYVIDA